MNCIVNKPHRKKLLYSHRFYSTGKGGKRRKENYRKEWLNYNKTNFSQPRKYFPDIDWREIYDASDIEKKRTMFLDIYNDGIQRWVPKRTTRELAKNDWFNKRHSVARMEREEA